MKTINDFFSANDNFSVLTNIELTSVKGGDTPPSGGDIDPFKQKQK